jgi:uncharacterized protein
LADTQPADKLKRSGGCMAENDYVIRLLDSPGEVGAQSWNALLASQEQNGKLNPFMRHEYLAALHESQSASPLTGWTPRFITLWSGSALAGACALYLKDHSYGEYVFDHAWANAYQQHGLDYYPKALVAVPFTPVPGPRLLARTPAERVLLVQALVAWCKEEELSSLHLLFNADQDIAACEQAGLMLRHTIQFHWKNVAPTLQDLAPTLPASRGSLPPGGALRLRPGEAGSVAPAWQEDAPTPVGSSSASCYRDFDDFLMSLSQEKRKKIRQERRKVAEAGITFRWSQGKDISDADWDFFYRCYERTYYEHGNAPYLSRDFFHRMQKTMPENWLLFIAERAGKAKPQPVASSLIALSSGHAGGMPAETAYGRYWGALARVDCLHFEACYYQPLQWCIEHGVQSFEGGAQGEHKMARALMPVKTTSAHWLAHPSFADAVERFLAREGAGIEGYMEMLEQRNPFRRLTGPAENTISADA